MSGRLFAAALLCAGVLACGEPATAPAPDAVAEPAVEAPPAPPAQPARYVGMWAVDSRLCDRPAWRFEEREISTMGEVNCQFEQVTPSASGYDIAASCTAEAPPAPFTIRLNITDPARGMSIEGGPWQEGTRLVKCGPLTED